MEIFLLNRFFPRGLWCLGLEFHAKGKVEWGSLEAVERFLQEGLEGHYDFKAEADHGQYEQ